MRKKNGIKQTINKPAQPPRQPPAKQETKPPVAPRLSPRRKFWFIVLVLAVIFIAQEVLFRYAFPLPEVEGFNRINYTMLHMFGGAFSDKSKRGLSNVRIIWQCEPDGFAFEHTLNLYGFRGPNFSIDPPADRPRVLFVGDSFVEGCGVADGDTIPLQFERLVGVTRPVEAINLGVAASNFPDYSPVMRDAIPLLRPKAVFLVVIPNDFDVRPFEAQKTVMADEFPRRNNFVPRILQVINRLLQDKVVPRRTPTGPFPFFEPVPSPTNPLTGKGVAPDVDAALVDAMRRGTANPWNVDLASFHEKILRWDFTSSRSAHPYLSYFQHLCQSHNCKLIVTYIPYLCTANPIYLTAQNKHGSPGFGNLQRVDQPPYRNQQEHLAKECRELGIPFLDTTDAFIEAEKGSQRLFWPYDAHCNAAGYRLVADICAKYWVESAQNGKP